ncbi:MAG: hypothetical protein OXI71_04475 [Gemmatimonadota bacterium]|nr:hypothetical protein [Gemmatimonadota bacterium]MDE2678019.1 hypothetical protein [Gemmatimonadota bacterium]
MVPWREGTGDDRSPDDLTALVLGVARNLSPEEMAAQLSGLWRTTGVPVPIRRETGSSGPA